MRDILALAKIQNDIFLVDSTNMQMITVAIAGKVGTPYEGGLFEVKLVLPNNYPYKYPKFFFNNRIFHPNVGSKDGRVCVDLLKENWSPSITLSYACETIKDLMAEPNPDSPLNAEAAVMMRDDKEMFDRTALLWTKHFANGVNTYEPYEEKLCIISALNANIEEALELLTDEHWDTEKASARVL